MPVLGKMTPVPPAVESREIERELSGRKSGRERDVHHRSGGGITERESRGRRGRSYRSSSYDSRLRSNSGARLRSGSVTSTLSMGSRRGHSRGHHGGGNNYSNHHNLPSLKNLRKQLRNQYNDKVMLVVTRYIEDMEASAEIVNNINYLRRCRDLGIIPKEYWMSNSSIRNTREVVRMLDECSYRLMLHDQQYHMVRRAQLSKQLTRTEDQLNKLLSAQESQRLFAVVKMHHSDIFSRIRDEQRKSVDVLRKEVEDYQNYLREKRKPRRSGERGSRKTRNRSSNDGRNNTKDDLESSNNRMAKSVDNKNSNNKESKDSDGEDGSAHRVQRRTVGSSSSHEEESTSED